MNIGFDAKRAFYNYSGLGNYSRHTVKLLSRFYLNNDYYLFTPGLKKAFHFIEGDNIRIVTPGFALGKLSRSLWRSRLMVNSIKKKQIDLFHGLSNELPIGIRNAPGKSIVTIHDLIFMRYPELYKPVDREIYTNKFRYSCEHADGIIAVSQQTKNDIVDFFGIRAGKIRVVYQGCDPLFKKEFSAEEKHAITTKYKLPQDYILYVGTIEERKNLMLVVEALHKGEIDVPLVVVGKPTKYLQKVVAYISKHLLEHIYFLTDVPLADLPAIYQMANTFVYPSIFEGFGIPILEAMNSKVPVITSTGGCFREAGADAPEYIHPDNVGEMIAALNKVIYYNEHRMDMISKGIQQARNFDDGNIVHNLYQAYQAILHP